MILDLWCGITVLSSGRTAAVATQHGLGLDSGSMVDNGDGTASYRKPATLPHRVRISEVHSFSVTKSSKTLERPLRIMGNGTELASASVNHGVAEKTESWFRAHPDFYTAAAAQPTSAGVRPAEGEAPGLIEQLQRGVSSGDCQELSMTVQSRYDAQEDLPMRHGDQALERLLCSPGT
jgi:hypothetical protein